MTSLRRHLRARVYSNLKTEQEIKTNSSAVYEHTSPYVLVPPPSGYIALHLTVIKNQRVIGKKRREGKEERTKGKGTQKRERI